MLFPCKVPIYSAFAAASLFVVACNSSQTSLPTMGSAHGVHGGSVPMRPATAGITTGKKYIYHGCVVYGLQRLTPTTGDPYANADITNATPDPNSSYVITAQTSNVTFDNSSDASLEIVNIATSTTPTYTAHTNGGHSGPLTLPAPSGFTATGPVPWQPGPSPPAFLFEGTIAGSCTSTDCHWTTLNTSNCYVFEGGGGTFDSGTTFKTYNGFIDDLSASYASQWANKFDNWSVAGIPGLGFTDYGEDFSLSSINHPLQVIVIPKAVQNVHVNLSPEGGADGTCKGGDSGCLDYGDILRLQSSVSCPSDSKAALVCNQLKTYGAVVADTQGTSTATDFRFGLDSSGNDDTNLNVFNFLSSLHLTNFDIITRGALVP